MSPSYKHILPAIAFLLALAAPAAHAEKAVIALPNLVKISPTLTTSGQPSPEALAGLAAQGFEAVVYVAPPWVSNAVADENIIVGRQGLPYFNIPIVFANPTEKDYEMFAAVMNALGKRKVLVHCQVNMRASSMVFLYRVLVGKEDPRVAYDAVTKVWVPDGAWKQLIQTQLKKHGVDFDPY